MILETKHLILCPEITDCKEADLIDKLEFNRRLVI